MTDVYRNSIDAPPIAPPRYSLLTTLPTVDEPGVRWEGGYSYVSELSGAHGAEAPENCMEIITGSNQVSHDWVNVEPVVVWAEAYCRSTLGGLPRDHEAVMRRKLNAHQSYDLAFSYLTDVLGGASAGSVGDTGFSVADGVASLEDRIGARLGGPLGTFWCSLGTLDMLVGAGVARVDGARYITAGGTPIAADAGFSALGPQGSGGGVGWIVATGPARVRLAPIEVPSADDLRSLVDPRTNSARLIAWRLAAVEIDFGDTTDTWPHPPEGAPFAFAVQVQGTAPSPA